MLNQSVFGWLGSGGEANRLVQRFSCSVQRGLSSGICALKAVRRKLGSAPAGGAVM